MKLKLYFEQFPLGIRRQKKKKIAQMVGVTEYALQHWINGRRKPTPIHAVGLEKVLEGAITRYDLRPDIYPEE